MMPNDATLASPHSAPHRCGGRRKALAAAIMAFCCACNSAALSDRLDKATCDGLKSEETGLVTAGVKTDMDRGPDWAKANLPPNRLRQIARLIELGEQISFRCKVIKAPPPSKEQAKTKEKDKKPAAANGKGAAAKTKPKVVRRKAAKSRPKKKPAARAKRSSKRESTQKKTGLFNFD